LFFDRKIFTVNGEDLNVRSRFPLAIHNLNAPWYRLSSGILTDQPLFWIFDPTLNYSDFSLEMVSFFPYFLKAH